MKQGSTILARGVVYLAGLLVLGVCFILLPELAREEAVGKPVDPNVTMLFLAFADILAVPFFFALYQTHKILNFIERNKFFTQESLGALQMIKVASIIFSGMVVLAVVLGITITKNANPSEDVTFMVTFGILFTFASSVVTVFMAVLQKLLNEAVSLKLENDQII